MEKDIKRRQERGGVCKRGRRYGEEGTVRKSRKRRK